MGLPERMATLSKWWGVVWAQAMCAIGQSTQKRQNLAETIAIDYHGSPRQLEEWEIAVMMHELAIRELRREQRLDQMSNAKEEAEKKRILEQLQKNEWSDTRLADIIKDTGTRSEKLEGHPTDPIFQWFVRMSHAYWDFARRVADYFPKALRRVKSRNPFVGIAHLLLIFVMGFVIVTPLFMVIGPIVRIALVIITVFLTCLAGVWRSLVGSA